MPCAVITRAAARDTRNDPRAITLCRMSQSAVVVSVSGFEIESPALLTTRSTPPNASAAPANAAATSSSLVTSAAIGTATSADPRSAATAARRRGVPVGHHHAGALGRQPLRRRPADPRPAAGHQGDPAGQRLGRGPPPQLGLLKLPVLDPELLALRNRRVGRDRLRPAHHVDRVDVELPRDPRGLLVRAEAEHADPGHQHDRRVGAAHRRRVRRRVPLVVGLVVLPVGRVQLAQPLDDRVKRRVRRQVHHHRRAPWCAGSGRGRRCRAPPARTPSRYRRTRAPRASR